MPPGKGSFCGLHMALECPKRCYRCEFMFSVLYTLSSSASWSVCKQNVISECCFVTDWKVWWELPFRVRVCGKCRAEEKYGDIGYYFKGVFHSTSEWSRADKLKFNWNVLPESLRKVSGISVVLLVYCFLHYFCQYICRNFIGRDEQSANRVPFELWNVGYISKLQYKLRNICMLAFEIPLVILTKLNEMDKMYSHTKEQCVTCQD